MRYLLALIIILLTGATALAQEESDEARAEYKEAQLDFDEGRYEEALTGFRAVHEKLGSPNARLYIARCLYELGRLPSAYEEMSATVREATERAKTEPRFLPTRDAAIEELAEIEAKVGRVSIIAPSPPDGLSVSVGQRAVLPEELGSAVAVYPGAILVTASAPGFRPFEKNITVGAGSIETVTLELQPEGEPEPVPVEEGGFGVREGGIIVAGVGVAGMVMFIVAGVMANDRFEEISDACDGGHCPDPSRDESIEDGRTLDIVANVGLGIGIAGLVAGGLMIILGWPDDEETAIVPAPDGIALRF